MPTYLLSVHAGTEPQGSHGQIDHDPAAMQSMMQPILDLEDKLVDAGAWVFSGRLTDAGSATVVRGTGSDHLITDGPYAESKEHVAGFYLIDAADLDEAGRDRLREIYDQSVAELSGALSDDLADELARLASPFGDTPASAGELRVAQAQLVGWLEGLFHGIQATLFAQQAAARHQLEQMRHQLVAGQQPGGEPDGHPPGTYL